MTTSKHDELLENLRGIRKVVINRCHGGFSLSHEAVLRYHELSGTRIYWQIMGPSSSWSPRIYYLDPECTDANHWNDLDIARDDAALVRVVEDLGSEKAGGDHAVLEIVRIPADVDWTVQEYDGMEWVAERHRTWP